MCKACQQETWHTILNETKTRWEDNEAGIWEDTTFFTLQCLGCDNVCLLTHLYFSEYVDPQTGAPELRTNVYPVPYKSDREPIKGLRHLPKDVKTIYEETIKAFNFGLVILTAIGVRTTLEAIAIQQEITVRGIESKINEMVAQKIITPNSAKLLLLVKDIGNLATHEIKKHHRDDLTLCINIIEGISRDLYIYPKEAKDTREMLSGRWIRV